MKTKIREKKGINDKEIAILAKELFEVLRKEAKKDLIEKTGDKTKKILQYPGVKEILTLLGTGSFVFLSAAVPSLPVIAKAILDEKRSRDWKCYNQIYLRRNLKRLKKQKMVQFEIEENKIIVKLSNQGKKKVLGEYLKELKIKKPRIWDRKWRLIIYDVPNRQRKDAEKFSRILKELGMYRLQKSVFLCPFPCRDEVVFLREFYGIEEYVWLLKVDYFENDEIFKDYFGIKI